MHAHMKAFHPSDHGKPVVYLEAQTHREAFNLGQLERDLQALGIRVNGESGGGDCVVLRLFVANEALPKQGDGT